MIKLQGGPSRIMTRDEVLPVIREGCVKYIDGKPVKSNLANFTIKANVQPFNGRDLLIVPEADRFKEQLWVFTQDQLLVNDRIERCGVNYQVQSAEMWGSFIRARVMRVDVGPNATP